MSADHEDKQEPSAKAEEESVEVFFELLGKKISGESGSDRDLSDILVKNVLKEQPAADCVALSCEAIVSLARLRALKSDDRDDQ